MATAGRAVIFSGATVAIGLALLLFMPLPFMRSMGVGGFLIPLVSIAGGGDAPAGAALALRPARDAARCTSRSSCAGAAAAPRLPGTDDVEQRLLGAARALDHAAPAGCYLARGRGGARRGGDPGRLRSSSRPGCDRRDPAVPAVGAGLRRARSARRPGRALAGAGARRQRAAPGGAPRRAVAGRVARLVARSSARDPEVAAASSRAGGRFVDPTGRYAQVIVADAARVRRRSRRRASSRRLRGELIPAARFPAGARVRAGGAPAAGRRLPRPRVRRLPLARPRRCSCSPTCC